MKSTNMLPLSNNYPISSLQALSSAKFFARDANLQPSNPFFFETFTEGNECYAVVGAKKTVVTYPQAQALLSLNQLPLNERASLPLFPKACYQYVQIVTNAKIDVLADSKSSARKKGEIFFEVIKFSQNDEVPEKTRNLLIQTGMKLSNSGFFRNLDLSEMDFSKLYLVDLNLINSNFTYSNLTETVWINCRLWNADFDHANLTKANMSNADLSNSSLRYTNLTKLNLSNSNLNNTSMYEANLTEANLSSASMRNVCLIDAKLPGANLTKTDLYFAELLNANMTNAILTGANLDKAILTGANLTGVVDLDTTTGVYFRK